MRKDRGLEMTTGGFDGDRCDIVLLCEWTQKRRSRLGSTSGWCGSECSVSFWEIFLLEESVRFLYK